MAKDSGNGLQQQQQEEEDDDDDAVDRNASAVIVDHWRRCEAIFHPILIEMIR